MKIQGINEGKIRELDSSIYQCSKGFRLLHYLDWPIGEDAKFLSGWRKGNPLLPEVEICKPPIEKTISELEELKSKCDTSSPLERFLFDTANSYANGARMVLSRGTTEFTRWSSVLYGRPDDEYKSQDITPLDAAKFLLDTTQNLLGNSLVPKTYFDIDADEFSEWMEDHLDDFFTEDKVDVVIDPTISAKALASSKKIKISEAGKFSDLDKKQLLSHEAYIHTGTALNGKKQPNLKCISLAPPRTTRTQEGLAVLSELFTFSMDIMRLRRIALRVPAVKMALDGADFIDVFKFFLEQGQTEEDSVRSAQRIFRGGDVQNGVVFTKDSVYLEGVLEVHTFMRLAIWHNRPEYIRNLFAGRMTLGDVLRLDEYFTNGFIRPPVYVPDWGKDFRRLSALMAFSAFMTNIHLERVNFENFVDFEERLSLH